MGKKLKKTAAVAAKAGLYTGLVTAEAPLCVTEAALRVTEGTLILAGSGLIAAGVGARKLGDVAENVRLGVGGGFKMLIAHADAWGNDADDDEIEAVVAAKRAEVEAGMRRRLQQREEARQGPRRMGGLLPAKPAAEATSDEEDLKALAAEAEAIVTEEAQERAPAKKAKVKAGDDPDPCPCCGRVVKARTAEHMELCSSRYKKASTAVQAKFRVDPEQDLETLVTKEVSEQGVRRDGGGKKFMVAKIMSEIAPAPRRALQGDLDAAPAATPAPKPIKGSVLAPSPA